jgi:peptide/nickel transport system ATP-binding protein
MVELETPASGEALFEGNSIFKRTKSEAKDAARQIQIIFQDPYSSLNPKMKIGDAIIEPMMVHGLYRDKREKGKNAFIVGSGGAFAGACQ